MRLKLLLSKDGKKVLFAEATKEFVDFLMGLMEIPLGSILRLLKQTVNNDEPSLSLEKLYESIHVFDESYLQKSELRNNVLDPTFTFDTKVKQAPFLKQIIKGGGSSSSIISRDVIDGYVKGVAVYMVMDDLTISPLSTISSINHLFNHDTNHDDHFEVKEVIVEVDSKKALELVRAAFQSSKVLTHVFASKN